MGHHLVLYDGVCGLCSRVTQFLLTHDRHAQLHRTGLALERRERDEPVGLRQPDDLFGCVRHRRIVAVRGAGVPRPATLLRLETSDPTRAHG